MLSLFTTTNVVSIVADVPVTGIEILSEDTVTLELYKSFEVEYRVMPIEATVKDVEFSFSQYAAEPLAEFDVDGNKLIARKAGWAIVTLQTLNGGYRDSFIIEVTTKNVTGIECTVDRDVIGVGESISIKTLVKPHTATNQAVEYSVRTGKDVVEVRNGVIKGIGVGTAVIEVTSVDTPSVKDEVTLTVTSSGVVDFVDPVHYLTVLESSGGIKAVVNPDITDYTADVVIESGYESVIDAYFDKAKGEIKYAYLDPLFVGDIDIKLLITPVGGETVEKTCVISRINDMSAEWQEKRPDAFYINEPSIVEINLKPSGASTTYILTLEYTAGTSVVGNISSGEQVVMTEGAVYTANGGYISVERVGNDLKIIGLYAYEDTHLISATSTVIRLQVINNGDPDADPIVLSDKIIKIYS